MNRREFFAAIPAVAVAANLAPVVEPKPSQRMYTLVEASREFGCDVWLQPYGKSRNAIYEFRRDGTRGRLLRVL